MQLWGPEYQLESLDLRCNRLRELKQLLFLGGLRSLKQLSLQNHNSKKTLNPKP